MKRAIRRLFTSALLLLVGRRLGGRWHRVVIGVVVVVVDCRISIGVLSSS
jgi:hypothetical protein